MTVDPSLLFAPFTTGDLTLPNRLVMAPMTRAMSPGGVPGADVAAYYRRRAEGGTGLIITEGTWIDHPAASYEDNAPRFHGEDTLAGWSEVVRQVHAAGGRIMPQLWHTGLTERPATENIFTGTAEDYSGKVSPSGILPPDRRISEPMAIHTAEEIIASYARGAATAEALGFDGIELHGAHGYLIDQFLWSATNRRTDRFGGDIGQRTRFAVEVVAACRAAVSPGFPIVFRFSQWKVADYAARLAQTPQELERILLPISEAGVDVFHASQRQYWHEEFPGSPLCLAGWAKKITGKPAIVVGSVGQAREVNQSMDMRDTAAEPLDRLLEMFAGGQFDLVAVGRALLGDAAWANKVRDGHMADIRPFNQTLMAQLD